MSGRCASSSRSNPFSSCTTAAETEKPPLRSVATTSSASSSLSSTCSTRSWPGSGPRSSVSVIRRYLPVKRIFRDRRVVGDQPVQSHALHRLPELLEVNWFLDIAIGSQVVARDQIPLFFRRRHDDNRDDLGPRIALDLSQHLEPINLEVSNPA